MATFSSLSETTNTSDSDYILVSQSGVDYKQQRETFMASVANTRWSDATNYTLGSEVIGSNNKKYYALNASFNEDPTTDDGTNWQYIERLPQVENYFKTNQNWNIEGDDGNSVPTTTSTTYADGEEIAAGIVADGEVIMIRSAGGLVSGTGSYYREYEGVDATDGFYGVKLNSNVISQTGVTVSLEGGNTRVTVNLAAAGAHKFVGLSEKVGVWPDISDAESSFGGGVIDGYDVLRDTGHSFTSSGYQKLSNGLILQWGNKSVSADSTSTATFPVTFPNECLHGSASLGFSFSTSDDAGCGVYNLSASSMTLLNGSNTSGTVRWFVIGY